MIGFFTSNLLTLPKEEEYQRIYKGEVISSINIPYTTEYINMLIKHFEDIEEYEKCSFLLKLSTQDTHNTKFNATI